jgi:tryptophanyl-tRNA synthetase
MYTDPNRIRADIPGTVEGNPVFTYLDQFDADKAAVAELKERYRGGRVGDVEVKERLTTVLNAFLDPVRERSAHYAAQSGLVDEIIYRGTLRMREIGAETLREVRKAMGLAGVFNRISRKAEERMKKGGGSRSHSCRRFKPSPSTWATRWWTWARVVGTMRRG